MGSQERQEEMVAREAKAAQAAWAATAEAAARELTTCSDGAREEAMLDQGEMVVAVVTRAEVQMVVMGVTAAA
jgi:hypothetical protein